MTYADATVLGLVEGITEFLPISSTGHLILANHALGLESEAQAIDRSGLPLWQEPPDPAQGLPGQPFTIKAAADTYAVAIQVGAIAAVAILYWSRVLGAIAGVFGKNPAGLRLTRNLLIAFFPAVVAGLTLDDWIEEHLFRPGTVAAALIVGAVIMVAADRRQRARAADAPDVDPSDLSPKQALLIGVMQCAALWPGMSRSMMTIVGGYVAGLRPARAAEFSFLLGLPTLTGAAVLKCYKSGALTLEAFGPGPLAWGGLVAAVSAGLAVAWLVRFLTRHGLALFAWYRVVLAVGVLVLLGA
ncbi:MAG: undecaprenyl-diphosphate phosphatase [Opitutaceae bacterium]|nr:undecaprenyl-diphosphate phosphatase [Opitutaceae bacterium]